MKRVKIPPANKPSGGIPYGSSGTPKTRISCGYDFTRFLKKRKTQNGSGSAGDFTAFRFCYCGGKRAGRHPSQAPEQRLTLGRFWRLLIWRKKFAGSVVLLVCYGTNSP